MLSQNIPNIFSKADVMLVSRLNKQIDSHLAIQKHQPVLPKPSLRTGISFSHISALKGRHSKITLKKVRIVAVVSNSATHY